MLNFVLITAFIAAACLALAVYTLLRGLVVGRSLKLANAWQKTADKNVEALETPLVIRDDLLSRIPVFNRWLQSLHVARNLQRLIEQANLSMRVGELVLAMLIFGGLGLLLTFNLSLPILRVIGFFLFGSLPLAYVSRRRRARLKRFVEQFPDAIDMMTSALQAGHAFGRALQLVATDAPDPIGMEFRKTFEEHNLGLPLKEALTTLTQRIDSVDLKLFVTAVLIQRESGGNLAEILGKIGHTIRARFKLVGHVKVLTAQGRFSGWILGTMPIGMGFILSALNPDYMKLLFEDPLGRYLIALGVTLQLIGFFVIRKIVRIKIG